VLDAQLPRALGVTMYARFGNYVWLVILLMSLILVVKRRLLS